MLPPQHKIEFLVQSTSHCTHTRTPQPLRHAHSLTVCVSTASGGAYTLVSGRNGESRSSLSVDSIDTPETHRRSKSILKKHESGGGQTTANHRARLDDPETEKLISDTASGASGSDYSPGKSPPSLRANSNKLSFK